MEENHHSVQFKNKLNPMLEPIINSKPGRRDVFGPRSPAFFEDKAPFMGGKNSNCFDYMKNSVARKPLHAYDSGSIDAPCFINHVALMYFYRLLRAMDRSGLKEEYSAEEIINRGNNIYKISEYIGNK